jgi:hypothetical protein
MGWHNVDEVAPPIGRPVFVHTVEADGPVIAFLSPERIWYAGGALVQSSTTLLGGTPAQWCEPQGDDSL